ncbi:ABC-type Mn2+/Zn2+ transport system, permease component [Methanocella conradii HZ254]|uniref:ABC-type Mn2+/Zn2+ transport system, permease component n=1 Tax=Methanocella conradii (strain DSM 24694 / JCM 17849 / CGMCC 1.5162 / HZ254) TaxID=1041930 RepID=H8I8V3_METCZ|nr:metal ABC transporter permease [Methanocella conradii]AFD00424.1 ABC-type Mn2+/Zn2+ transport system, permease component [Methanocella conradii HZ254]MDI6895741.1 metal ABC transporter permease [Methanocella conradii]
MLEPLIQNNVVCHAVEAMVFASIACSILGVIISRMGLSSMGFTMSHAAFAGAAIGMFLDMSAQLAAIAFSVGVAALIGPISDKAKMAADATLGVLFAMSMAVAIFLISYMQYMGKGLSASALLFGDVISLYREEIYALAAISILTIAFVLVFYKEIAAIMFNMKIAEASGIRVKVVYYILLFIIALSVALSLNIVGGLLIFVWLVTPAAIASQFCFNVKSMFIVAPLVALIISVVGVWAGFEFTLPIAPLVALLLTGAFGISVVISFKRRVSTRMH